MSTFDYQDWKPVVLRNNKATTTVNKDKEINTTPKIIYEGGAKLSSLTDNTDGGSHETVGKQLGGEIMAARIARKWTQADLAKNIKGGLDVHIIKNYENGTAIRNSAIIQKIQSALGIKLNICKK
jgi:ribosome-binding protein aMBF1 (putative translation factor)